MALSPEIEFLEEEATEIQTSRTYKIDFENGRMTGEIIDGIEAIKQFIYIALRISRYSFPIYSSDVGSEIEALVSDKEITIAYIKMELPRLITEAIIYDERISNVDDFEIEHIGDAFHVNFTVTTVEGVIEMEEVL